MNESTKKAVLIGVAVLALAVAGFSAFRSLGGPPLEKGVDNSLPAGSKTGKQLEMENQGGGAAAGGSERANAADRG
ncbi:hypothetical protein EON82_12100 [bacterium]|nr:MAG: hypothetical protein EON82_12100 [bacterium]